MRSIRKGQFKVETRKSILQHVKAASVYACSTRNVAADNELAPNFEMQVWHSGREKVRPKKYWADKQKLQTEIKITYHHKYKYALFTLYTY